MRCGVLFLQSVNMLDDRFFRLSCHRQSIPPVCKSRSNVRIPDAICSVVPLVEAGPKTGMLLIRSLLQVFEVG